MHHSLQVSRGKTLRVLLLSITDVEMVFERRLALLIVQVPFDIVRFEGFHGIVTSNLDVDLIWLNLFIHLFLVDHRFGFNELRDWLKRVLRQSVISRALASSSIFSAFSLLITSIVWSLSAFLVIFFIASANLIVLSITSFL